MSHHHATAPVPSAWQDRAQRDPRAWVAPTVATVLGGLLAPVAFLFGGLSVMATDSCGPDDCSQALTTALNMVFGTLFFGGLLAGGAWLASWLLPWLSVLALVFNLPEG